MRKAGIAILAVVALVTVVTGLIVFMNPPAEIGTSRLKLVTATRDKPQDHKNTDLSPTDRDNLHQVSTLNALLNGLYDGQVSYGELRKYGDTGIGTFAALDGEMIEIDGRFYQIKADGKAYPVDDTMTTPFASVSFFDADQSLGLKTTDWTQLQKTIDKMISNKNLFYVIRVNGDFSYVKTRSVPAQKKPYPPLVEVTKNQPVFELDKVRGSLVGFWCPAYVNGINVPGYHLHFITADNKAGGHLLDFRMQSGQLQIDATPNFSMALPANEDFGRIKDRSLETNKVEK